VKHESARPCPCQSGESYRLCCGRFHSGEASAPTAVRLMRSRYAAFAVGEAAYLLTTWHPLTRPRTLQLDPAQRWFSLEILGTSRGGMLDTEGTVEFRAHYRTAGEAAAAGQARAAEQHEVSRFVREGGRWLYVSAL
jgi:SEC-C motif domain protein